MSRSRNMIIDRKFVWYRMEKMTKIVLLIDHIQQWKMQVIWNQFHRQNCLILKRFSNFEARAPWNGSRFSWKFWCCMRSLSLQIDNSIDWNLRQNNPCSRPISASRLRCQSEKWADMGTFNTEWYAIMLTLTFHKG